MSTLLFFLVFLRVIIHTTNEGRKYLRLETKIFINNTRGAS